VLGFSIRSLFILNLHPLAVIKPWCPYWNFLYGFAPAGIRTEKGKGCSKIY
jgi:hypothetical protein